MLSFLASAIVRRGLASILSALAMLVPCAATAATPWGADYFPNVTLTDQEGQRVRLYDDLLKGKSVAINVIYTSCKDECPLETAQLARLQQLLGDKVGRDIFFYSITIDPETDTPQVLKRYASSFKAGAGWRFLTGNRDDIRLVLRKLGLSRQSDAQSKDGHAASLMIGHEPTGQWMRNSAVDNPRFLSATMARFFGWTDPAATGYAQARPVAMDKGRYLFESRCSACHRIGGGEAIGPDLAGLLQRRDRGWVARYIAAPESVVAAGDAAAMALRAKYDTRRMPNLNLGTDDVADVMRYLENHAGAAPLQEHTHAGHEDDSHRHAH